MLTHPIEYYQVIEPAQPSLLLVLDVLGNIICATVAVSALIGVVVMETSPHMRSRIGVAFSVVCNRVHGHWSRIFNKTASILFWSALMVVGLGLIARTLTMGCTCRYLLKSGKCLTWLSVKCRAWFVGILQELEP